MSGWVERVVASALLDETSYLAKQTPQGHVTQVEVTGRLLRECVMQNARSFLNFASPNF